MDGPHCFNRSQHFSVDLSSVIQAALSHHATFHREDAIIDPNMILLGSTKDEFDFRAVRRHAAHGFGRYSERLATTIGSVGLSAPSAWRLPSNNMSAVVLRRTKDGLAQPSGRSARNTPGPILAIWPTRTFASASSLRIFRIARPGRHDGASDDPLPGEALLRGDLRRTRASYKANSKAEGGQAEAANEHGLFFSVATRLGWTCAFRRCDFSRRTLPTTAYDETAKRQSFKFGK